MQQLPKRKHGCRRLLIASVIIIAFFACIGSFISRPGDMTPAPAPTHAASVATPTPTIQPTATPTQKPTPTPTPKPQPTKPSVLSITFTLADAGYVAVHTLPKAALTIKVLYCSGHYATSQSLQGTVYADIAGDYIWNWTVSTSCHGQATAYVTASLNGKTVSGQANFTT